MYVVKSLFRLCSYLFAFSTLHKLSQKSSYGYCEPESGRNINTHMTQRQKEQKQISMAIICLLQQVQIRYTINITTMEALRRELIGKKLPKVQWKEPLPVKTEKHLNNFLGGDT